MQILESIMIFTFFIGFPVFSFIYEFFITKRQSLEQSENLTQSLLRLSLVKKERGIK